MFYLSRKIERSRFMQPGKFLLFPAICSCCLLLRAGAMPIETDYRKGYPPLNHYLYPQAFSTVATAFRFVAGPAFSDSVQTALEEKRKAAIRQQHWTEAAKLSNSLSVYYYSNLRYDEAIRYSTEGVDFARKANHPTLEATNLYGLGVVYFEKFDYPLAVEYCLKALRLAPRITDAELLIAINNRLGMVYKRIGDYDKAKAYLLPAYQDALRLKKGPLKDLLMNLGNTEEYLGNYKQSLAYYQRYLALTPADAFTQVLAYNNMGAIYMKLNEPQKAEALFHKAYAVEDTVKNIQGRAYSFYDFAWAAQAQNRCSEAIGYALKSLEEAKRYGVKSLEWLNYQLLSDCYNKTGNFQLANEYLGKYHVTKDSIYASQRLSKIGVLEATYRFEQESGKKQQEILSLQKENALKQLEVSNLLNKEKITQLQLANLANEKRLAQLQVSNLQQEDSLNRLKLENYNKAIVVNEMAVKNLRQQNEVKNLALSLQRRNQLLLGFGLFSLVGGFVLFYRYQRLRKRKELEKIRATIAADFHDELGSTLSSIALSSEMALYSHGEADKQLKTVLSQISESSRNTVLAMKDMIWTIEPANDNLQEMIFRMKAYAFPLAEVKNMQLNLQVDEKIKSLNLSMEKRKNCYLVFKEALNNAFKYSGAENIIVTLNSEGEQLALLIRDNGKGFDLATVKGGNGLRNMQKRAKQSGGTLLIESKSEGGGTSIFFTCPLA